ncbi:SGNH/GDSL hydrolase family protein [Acetobacter persici]|uniref:SGNH/GDSL hydrolase family protein n=1 Tax=Acetobacter persici TaxID=1076596 RepID=UPI001BA9026D|nr:SGNH/GDSL hydrolase family protein [Acetobacter persici]MBS1017301.1 SGNH/GDSL hydrolase family protein [Acetobacter persici]
MIEITHKSYLQFFSVLCASESSMPNNDTSSTSDSPIVGSTEKLLNMIVGEDVSVNELPSKDIVGTALPEPLGASSADHFQSLFSLNEWDTNTEEYVASQEISEQLLRLVEKPEINGANVKKLVKNDIFRGRETVVVHLPFGSKINNGNDAGMFAAGQIIVAGCGELKGFFKKQVHREYLSSPRMFPATVKARHLKRFHEACATGSAKVVIMGDSIFSIGADLISTAESPVFVLIDELMKQNPCVDIQVTNCAIGGQSWLGMEADDSKPPPWYDNEDNLSWKEFVAGEDPDLLILYSGGNDGYNISSLSMHKLIEYFQNKDNYKTKNIPSIVLGVTYQPSLGSVINNYNEKSIQDGITYALTYVRNYAVSKGLGYLDFGRWHSMLRDGVDPCELTLTRVSAKEDTTLGAWSEEMPVDEENKWIFPPCVNEIGVQANRCTDWLIAFLVTENPEYIKIPLSAKNYTDVNVFNDLFILNSNGKIRVYYQDGAYNNQFDKISDIDWPLGASTWTIVKKNGRVRVQIQVPLRNTWNIYGQTNVNNGMGMVTVWDHEIIAFGAPYQPEVRLGVNAGIIVYNLCVGDSTAVQTGGNCASGQRYRPIVSDYEIYVGDDNHTGGSSAFHMNAYGVRMVLAPVIRAQEWGRPNC